MHGARLLRNSESVRRDRQTGGRADEWLDAGRRGCAARAWPAVDFISVTALHARRCEALSGVPQQPFLLLLPAACCRVLLLQYEPELFPGLIYRMKDPKIVLLIFVSGKVVLTGGGGGHSAAHTSLVGGALPQHRCWSS